MGHKYQTFEPGKYLDWEKPVVEKRLALAQNGPPKNQERAIEPISEYEIREYNQRWDPDNPLFNNKEYAQKAGYPNIPARPLFRGLSSVDLSDLVIEPDIADIWYMAADGFDIRYFKPIYAGDCLNVKREKITFEDITVPGSDLRHFRYGGTTSVYNQNGELVFQISGPDFHRNAYRQIIDGSPKTSFQDHPVEWLKDFPPRHYTTDEDWEYIKELWDKEYIRGKNTLYWEDVKVGDEPIWTCSGPISHIDMMGWYPDRFMPKRNTLRDAKALYRDKYGIYLPGFSRHYSNQNMSDVPMVFFNDTGARHIVRMITNYIGDAGFVTRICWRSKQLFKEMWVERPGGEFLDKVPYMKGKECTRHGVEGDTVIAKGYVTDKYINDRGEHIIDISCWAETLDKNIIQVVGASVRLPSRGK